MRYLVVQIQKLQITILKQLKMMVVVNMILKHIHISLTILPLMILMNLILSIFIQTDLLVALIYPNLNLEQIYFVSKKAFQQWNHLKALMDNPVTEQVHHIIISSVTIGENISRVLVAPQQVVVQYQALAGII